MITYREDSIPVCNENTEIKRTVMDNITDIRDNLTLTIECMRAIYAKMWGENIAFDDMSVDNIDKAIVSILDQTRLIRSTLDAFYGRMGF